MPQVSRKDGQATHASLTELKMTWRFLKVVEQGFFLFTYCSACLHVQVEKHPFASFILQEELNELPSYCCHMAGKRSTGLNCHYTN